MGLFRFCSWRVRLLIISLVFLATGTWMFLPTWNARKQVECNLAQLYAGTLPESNWVRVRGRLLWDEAGVETGRRGSVTAYFVPLVPGNWNESQPIQAIVRIRESDAENMQNAVTVDGLIQPLGLPFNLALTFGGDEGAHIGENVVYIHHGTNPDSQRRFALVVIGIGMCGVIGFFVMSKMAADDDASTTYHSQARARDINEVVQRTTEEEQRHQEQEAERESEVDRWMRERGLKKPAAEQEAPADAQEAVAAR